MVCSCFSLCSAISMISLMGLKKLSVWFFPIQNQIVYQTRSNVSAGSVLWLFLFAYVLPSMNYVLDRVL